jgi:hypothetical protein
VFVVGTTPNPLRVASSSGCPSPTPTPRTPAPLPCPLPSRQRRRPHWRLLQVGWNLNHSRKTRRGRLQVPAAQEWVSRSHRVCVGLSRWEGPGRGRPRRGCWMRSGSFPRPLLARVGSGTLHRAGCGALSWSLSVLVVDSEPFSNLKKAHWQLPRAMEHLIPSAVAAL